jgi:glucosamine-6-phosphate deaminase
MKVLRFDSADEVATAVAARVIATVWRHSSHCVIGLPAGRTMVPIYDRLRRSARTAPTEWAQVHTFQVDEFAGLRPGDAGSFRTFLQRQLLDGLPLGASRTNFLNGEARDAVDECSRYELAIANAGGLDLQLLGIGVNGHIGFNEPGDTLAARTHLTTLHEETRRANATWFGNDMSRVPRQALTMGMGTLLAARAVILVATGDSKAHAVRRAVTGRLTTRIPASFLQLHAAVELFVDAAAASGLPTR